MFFFTFIKNNTVPEKLVQLRLLICKLSRERVVRGDDHVGVLQVVQFSVTALAMVPDNLQCVLSSVS